MGERPRLQQGFAMQGPEHSLRIGILSPDGANVFTCYCIFGVQITIAVCRSINLISVKLISPIT